LISFCAFLIWMGITVAPMGVIISDHKSEKVTKIGAWLT